MTTNAFDRAAGIAVGIAQDNVGTRHGPHWSYSPDDRSFQLPLTAHSKFTAYEKALAAHEAAHLRVSRYPLFRPFKGLGQGAFSHLFNAIEDCRVQAWAMRTYPGSAAWFQVMWAVERAEPAPKVGASLFLQFVVAASVADAFDWRVPSIWRLDSRVARALTETAKARLRYATVELPDLSLAQEIEAGGGLAQCLKQTVDPILRHRAPALPPCQRGEAMVLVSAARAYLLARSAILPVASALLRADIDRIQHRAETEGEFRRALEDAMCGGGVQDLVEHALSESRGPFKSDDDTGGTEIPRFLRRFSGSRRKPGPPWTSTAQLAQTAYERFLASARAGRSPPQGGLTDAAETRQVAGAPTEPLRPAGGGEPNARLRGRIEETLQTQLEPLVRRLDRAFRRAPRLELRAGFASGHRPDLKAVMRFEADRRAYDRLWIRHRRTEDHRRAAVLILVDLSGSMAGAEIEAAIQGVSVLAKALQRLGEGIQFGVYGFQDVLTPPYKTFDQPLTPAVMRGFEDMNLEVHDRRPGGNNQHGHNDDGPCLAEAAEILQRRPCPERLLVVVSDGMPAGRRSDSDDLRTAIRETRRKGIRLVGLGLGSGTTHVADFYAPDFVASIPPDQFASQIGEVVVAAVARA